MRLRFTFGMMIRWALLPLLLAGCGDYPRDTAGTLDRVRGDSLRIGRASVSGHPAADRLVRELGRRTGGNPAIMVGEVEALLMQLEHGELDLVVGAFDKKTPWTKRVTFSKPLASAARGDGTEEIKAASRNGEHAWAMEIDRAVATIVQAR